MPKKKSSGRELVVSEDILARVGKILEPSLNAESRFIPDYHDLSIVIKLLKAMGKRIVMTKGVFDMLHVGHARYIADAKSRGDILVMSIDTDALTRIRKGPRRPVVPETERLEMLLHTRYVDIITFRSGRPEEEEEDIDAVRPDILVTSATTADYTAKKKAGLKKKYGLTVMTLQAQATTTTSARIRDLMTGGADDLGKAVVNAVDEFLKKVRG